MSGLKMKRCGNCATLIGRYAVQCQQCGAKQPHRISTTPPPMQAPMAPSRQDAPEPPPEQLIKLPNGMTTVQAIEAAVRTLAMQLEYMVAQIKIISDVVELMKLEGVQSGSPPGSEEAEGSSAGVAEPEGSGTPEPSVARDDRNKDGEGGNGAPGAA